MSEEKSELLKQSIVQVEDSIRTILNAEFADQPDFVTQKPFLAHYTSLAVAEQIIRTREFWFSHPLYMNDFSEVAFALERAIARLLENESWTDLFPDKTVANELHHMVQWWKDRYVRSHFGTTFLFSLFYAMLRQRAQIDTGSRPDGFFE